MRRNVVSQQLKHSPENTLVFPEALAHTYGSPTQYPNLYTDQLHYFQKINNIQITLWINRVNMQRYSSYYITLCADWLELNLLNETCKMWARAKETSNIEYFNDKGIT